MGEAVGSDLHSVPASLNVDSQRAEVKNRDLGLILRNLARLDDDEVAEHHLNGVSVAKKVDYEVWVLGFVPLDDRSAGLPANLVDPMITCGSFYGYISK